MNSTSLLAKSPVQVIDDIRTKLADKRSGSGAAYAMIVGAGFSYRSVPLTKELLHEHIGDFYYLDHDVSAMELETRPFAVSRLSAKAGGDHLLSFYPYGL